MHTAPTALITGATAGIGHAFAVELAGRGYDLVLVARDIPRLDTVAEELVTRHGVSCETLPADLATEAGITSVANRLADPAAPVEMLVNNAGFALRRPFLANPVADELAGLDVLVRAPMQLSHAAMTAMVERGSGSVINVSSVAGFTPRGTYGAHKAWLISFSRWADLQYRERGVRVMALCPGFVHTELHQRANARTDNIPGWMWLEAPDLVRDALADLFKGRRVSVPTFRYKVIAAAAQYVPAPMVARIAKLGR